MENGTFFDEDYFEELLAEIREIRLSEIRFYPKITDIYGGLKWLDYNFKRSLCIENSYKQDEIDLAENEIIQSIREIKYNVSQMNKIIEVRKKE